MTKRLTQRSTSLVIALVVAGLVGCSADQASDDYLFTEDEVKEMVELERRPSQDVFFEDGVITAAERERAYLNFVECASAEGVTISNWILYPTGGDQFDVDDTPPEDFQEGAQPITNADKVVDTCRGDHYVAINVWWSYYNRRTGAELLDFLEATADCMREMGIEVPEGATSDQMESIDHGSSIECSIAADRR